MKWPGWVRWPNRILSLYLLGYVILVIGIIGAFAAVEKSNKEDAFRLCQLGNESREAIANAILNQARTLVAASSADRTPRSPEEEAQRERSIKLYLDQTKRDLEPLAPRPCAKP